MFRKWLLRPLVRPLTRIILTMSAILDIANKVSADIDTKLAAKDAQIASLTADLATANASLAALQASDADTTAAVQVLTDADAKLTT